MSIELEVSLNTGTLVAAEWIARVRDLLVRLFGDEAQHQLCIRLGVDDPSVVGRAELSGFAEWRGGARIGILCLFTAEGGWWLSFSVASRIPESMCLLAICATCAADCVGAEIVDEAGLLSRGRLVRAKEVLQLVATGAGRTPTQVAVQLFPGSTAARG